MQLNKKQLSERDICTKFITPALEKAGWDKQNQFLEEVSFTDGRIYVRGKLAARGQCKRADYILYYKPNIPIAIIEAKDNKHSVRAGIQQALEYARILDIPCVFSSNGDGFLFHDRSASITPGASSAAPTPLVIAAGNPQRHEGSHGSRPLVIPEGEPQRNEGSHDVTTHLTSQVVFDDDKSGLNMTSQVAFGHDKSGVNMTSQVVFGHDKSGVNMTSQVAFGHDKSDLERELSLDQFPTPAELWEKYKRYKNITTEEEERIIGQDYYADGSGRRPRYYQQIAINRTVEAVAKGQNRILLVMATGTGKTYTAFQIVWRLWKAGVKKRILFLADRNALINQTRRGDFKHFGEQMTVVRHGKVDKAYEIYLALYQGLSVDAPKSGGDFKSPPDFTPGSLFKEFSPDFFDLIVIDECHRGSASADSAWREILDYFTGATQLGLTATPKETHEASNYDYFGEPIYTYSLRQGINDGFLAPYRTVRIGINVDLEGWRPEKNKTDKDGNPVPFVIAEGKPQRHEGSPNWITHMTSQSLPRDIGVVFDDDKRGVNTTSQIASGNDKKGKKDIDHAERMRSALANWNKDLVAINHKYVMQITGDNPDGYREGQAALDNFINPQETYPVIANPDSYRDELMTTGVDAQTCQVIVLDANINSMTKFKQIIGRGTRINEEYGKMYFLSSPKGTCNVTDLFADPPDSYRDDGDPIVPARTYGEDDDLSTLITEEQEMLEDLPVIDEETGDEIGFDGSQAVTSSHRLTKDFFGEPTTPTGYARKVYVNGVDVTVLNTREIHFDHDGMPITTSLKDYTSQLIKGQYASLDAFLSRWKSAGRKEALIQELQEQGVPVDALRDAVNREVDLFDLICHVAYDQPPLTRRERAMNVKKRDYFTRYGEQARRVLEALLDKYADEGIENLESLEVLKVRPLTEFGSAVEIVQMFGGKDGFLKAVRELEGEIYRVA